MVGAGTLSLFVWAYGGLIVNSDTSEATDEVIENG